MYQQDFRMNSMHSIDEREELDDFSYRGDFKLASKSDLKVINQNEFLVLAETNKRLKLKLVQLVHEFEKEKQRLIEQLATHVVNGTVDTTITTANSELHLKEIQVLKQMVKSRDETISQL